MWKGCIILSSALVALLVGSWWVIDWPAEAAQTYPGGVVLRDNAGQVLRVSLGEGDIDCRPYYEADPGDWIVKALIAAEDGTYWEHFGVRPLSVLRAMWQNLFYHRRISGASTITMQTVRMIRSHPKTLSWKFREAIMALQLERERDKRWILSQYLNRAPFGSNLVGIEAAANGWFGKSAKNLGLGEAAMLAGMVQAPSRFRPDRGMERPLKRREYVLRRMLELAMITPEQFEGANRVRPEICRGPRPFRCPYYCDYWLRELGAGTVGQKPHGDYRTALDADLQLQTENAVAAAAEQGGYSVAAVVMRADSGEIVALTCSGDYFDPSAGQVNTALAPRPAGSTLKPFLMAQAMDWGYVTPEEELEDSPRSFHGYHPANFDGKYRGRVQARDALILSLNLPFVELLSRLGVTRFGAKLRDLGFNHIEEPYEQYGLGMAIGNVEVTLVELVKAYGVLARGGEGHFSRRSAIAMAEILSGPERSASALGHVADVRLSTFAWKTGTSSAYRDAWTIAWNPEYVIGVWCGHKSGGFGDQTVVGAKAAAPVAWTIARSLYPQNEGPWFEGAAIGRSGGSVGERGRREEDRERTAPLVLVKPEPGAKFALTGDRQKVVCRVMGGKPGDKLWWFLDGAPYAEGVRELVVEVGDGRHTIVCSTAEGESVVSTIELFREK